MGYGMKWFFSAIRIAGAAFPLASSLVQLQAETDSQEFARRLEKLEDPISNLHSDIRPLSQKFYHHIKKQDSLRVKLDKDDYSKYSRALAVLESKSYIKGSHAIGMNFVNGLRITDPTYLLYMCALFDDSEAMNEIQSRVDSCNDGQHIEGKNLRAEFNIPLPVIDALFQVYESKGYGLCSKEIGSVLYIGIA